MKNLLLTLLSAILIGLTASAQEADSAAEPPTYTEVIDSALHYLGISAH